VTNESKLQEVGAGMRAEMLSSERLMQHLHSFSYLQTCIKHFPCQSYLLCLILIDI
jgi:hypothetical protein